MTSGGHNTDGLLGLVLAGGRSTRMGQDKGLMRWHGTEQRYHMADLVGTLCSDVYISCRQEQVPEIDGRYKTLPDDHPGAGPLIGILSAFKAHPAAAWLVVACDLPLLDAATLRYLVAHRDPAAMATTFKSPHDGLPEPLITIWEPSAYAKLLAHVADGFTCPRKALIRNEASVRLLIPPHPDALLNTNTPGDADKAAELLNKIGDHG